LLLSKYPLPTLLAGIAVVAAENKSVTAAR